MNVFGSIRFKIFLCVAVAFIGFFGAAVSTLQSNAKVSSSTTILKSVKLPFALKAGETADLFRKQLKLYEDSFLSGDQDAYAAGKEASEKIRALLEEMSVILGKNQAADDKLLALKTKYASFANAAERTYNTSTDASLGAEGQQASTNESKAQDIQQVGLQQKELLEKFDALYLDAVHSVEAGLENSRKTVSLNSKILLVILAAVFIVTLLVLNFVARRLLIDPLHSLQETVETLASGELDLVVTAKKMQNDEISLLASALHDMAEKLRQMVLKIVAASHEVQDVSKIINSSSLIVSEGAALQAENAAGASSAVNDIVDSVHFVAKGVDTLFLASSSVSSSILEMSSSTEEVALNAEEVAHLATEVATSIEETNAAAKQIAASAKVLKNASDTVASSVSDMAHLIASVEENASQTATVAGNLLEEAENGKNAVEVTITGIKEIKYSSETTCSIIEELANKARNINIILNIINDVTVQTSLLSLNANIIAAQAGEQGRSFAVVASEIRELAVRTANSTKDAADIIKSVDQETERALSSIRQGVKSITEGEVLSLKAGEALSEILQSARTVAVRMEDIAKGTAEQTRGEKVIREATENVSQMIQHIASATLEQQAGGELIMRSTERLKEAGTQMRYSTREQTIASRNISQSMEQISEMISGIKKASDKQNNDSTKILSAIVGVKTVAEKNVSEARLLDNAVGTLLQQTNVLQQEMGAFHLTKSSS